jgi:hypothetical protein
VERRRSYPAWEFQAGNLRGFINGTICRGKVQERAEEDVPMPPIPGISELISTKGKRKFTMRRLRLLRMGLMVLAIVLESAVGQAQEMGKPKQAKGNVKTVSGPSGPLPSSLAALYPPKTKQPLLLVGMFELGTYFSGIVAELFESGLPAAKATFNRFKAQYGAVSKLVPEWENNFPMDPVEELGKAFGSEDRGKVMAAFQKVSEVCHNCHVSNMPRVQQEYRWGNFFAVKVKDPLSKEDVDFPRLMQYLDANFAGIRISLERGDKEIAQRQFQGFNGRFQALKEVCWNCHDSERQYYVNPRVQALVDKLGQALNGPSVDPKLVEQLRQGIGMESCSKCHLVHIPAAYTQLQSVRPEKAKGK